MLCLDEVAAHVTGDATDVLRELLHGQLAVTTALLITHELETVMHCDRIAVLDGGRIAEIGGRDEMLSVPGSVCSGMHRAGNVE